MIDNPLFPMIYEKSYTNPVMTLENPSLFYDKGTEEISEMEDLLRRLKKKNKQLKKEVKEYQVLIYVIQQENNQFKA